MVRAVPLRRQGLSGKLASLQGLLGNLGRKERKEEYQVTGVSLRRQGLGGCRPAARGASLNGKVDVSRGVGQLVSVCGPRQQCGVLQQWGKGASRAAAAEAEARHAALMWSCLVSRGSEVGGHPAPLHPLPAAVLT